MSRQFQSITPELQAFIGRQKMFFTGSTAADGRVNVSPKGQDAFRILSPNAVAYMDLTGSGNETAAHLRATGRLTIMFCAFEGAPLILRLYGQGACLMRGSEAYSDLLASAFEGAELPGARQIIRLDVDLVQTSCGMAVPLYDYREQREQLIVWAEKQGESGLEAYRRQKNARSIDGLPTGMFSESGV